MTGRSTCRQHPHGRSLRASACGRRRTLEGSWRAPLAPGARPGSAQAGAAACARVDGGVSSGRGLQQHSTAQRSAARRVVSPAGHLDLVHHHRLAREGTTTTGPRWPGQLTARRRPATCSPALLRLGTVGTVHSDAAGHAFRWLRHGTPERASDGRLQHQVRTVSGAAARM